MLPYPIAPDPSTAACRFYSFYKPQKIVPPQLALPRIKCYLDMDKAGFDQIATASNNVFDSNAGETVEFCEKNLSGNLLKGYLMSSWRRTMPEYRKQNLAAVDLMADACRKHIR